MEVGYLQIEVCKSDITKLIKLCGYRLRIFQLPFSFKYLLYIFDYIIINKSIQTVMKIEMIINNHGKRGQFIHSSWMLFINFYS